MNRRQLVKTPRVALPGSGVHQGTVTRVAAGDVYVELPRVSPGLEYGPCMACETPTPFAAGDLVLVAFVEGRRDDPAIVCRLA